MNADKKALLRDSIYAGLIFTVIYGIIQSWMASAQFASITAPIGGILFGIFTYYFIKPKKQD